MDDPREAPLVAVQLSSPIQQAGVVALLRRLGFEVLDDPPEALDVARPAVLVVDESWLDASADFGALPDLPLVGLGPLTRAVADVAALMPSGWAWLPAEASANELRAGVLAASAGLAALPAEQLGDLGGAPGGGPARLDEPLTPRERDVLDLIAQGLSNKRVAQRLGVSENTVKFHVQALFGKLGVNSRAGATSRAIQLGLIFV